MLPGYICMQDTIGKHIIFIQIRSTERKLKQFGKKMGQSKVNFYVVPKASGFKITPKIK